MLLISVVICTHNPRAHYFKRVLGALMEQSLARAHWELLIVDNNSNEAVAGKWDLSWHPTGRHIHEEQVGANFARMRGMREAAADVILFVDDDNVLAANYLETALELGRRCPWLGAWGGSTLGEFEVAPRKEVESILFHLAVRKVTSPAWICASGTQVLHYAPFGAGMAFRKEVAQDYLDKVAKEPMRRLLGRKGESLAAGGGEDSDIALCACALGLAVGVFPELTLIHLIPATRLEPSYLLRLTETMYQAHALLDYLWSEKRPALAEIRPAPHPGFAGRIWHRVVSAVKRRTSPSFADLYIQARMRGQARGRAALEQLLARQSESEARSV